MAKEKRLGKGVGALIPESDIPKDSNVEEEIYKGSPFLGTMTLKDFNNEYHTVTKAELEQIVKDVRAYGFSSITKKWTKEQAIMHEDCDTVEKVLAIDWNSTES